MMTLKEAIKHCKDVALSCTNKECALEHFQLLKWLQEYNNMLEKQVPIDEEKVLIGVRRDVALSIMDFLDRNTLGMCLSNMECADLENAVVDSDWSKVYDYMKKKLEKQSEQNPYSGVSFKYNGHTYGMCARDNGVEILVDGKIKERVLPQGKSALEAIKEEKIDNQNYVKPAKVEPKFHEDEWIIHQGTENIYQVVARIDNQYQLRYGDNYTVQKCADVDRCARLWDITKDAKDGDVLVNGSNIFIFHFINDTRLMGYCHVNTDNGIFYDDIGKNECFCLIDAVVNPATKEQRDLLFSKMKEGGYEWDAEKKELKKIHVIDEGKAEMDYCFTKMMAGEKVSPTWSEEDERLCQCLIRDQEEALDEVRNDKYGHSEIISDLKEMYCERIDWLESLKQRIGG